MDLNSILLHVRREIDEYVYQLPKGAIGRPLSDSKVQAHLKELRDSLISPYWATIKMSQPFALIGSGIYETRECVIVADPKDGYLLFFDPVANSFGVANQRDNELFDVGIPGDAVGCFMAR
jgi:hypothetical protein